MGEVRRNSEVGADVECQKHALELADLLRAHNRLEEEGLFDALALDAEFSASLAKLRIEHDEIDGLVARLISGEYALVSELEVLLRNNISNEENGLFPASAVTLDGHVWDRIEVAQGVKR